MARRGGAGLGKVGVAYWRGRRGRVSEPLLRELLPLLPLTGLLVAVCGPVGFSKECARLLKELGVPEQQVHVFDG